MSTMYASHLDGFLAKHRLSFVHFVVLHFAEQLQVGSQNDTRIQITRVRDRQPVKEMVHQQADSNLALQVRVLINRRTDRALAQMRDHFWKEVRGDELHLVRASTVLKRAAYRQAVDRADVNSAQTGMLRQQLTGLTMAFFF